MKNQLKEIIKKRYCEWSVNKYYHVLRVLTFAAILSKKKKLSEKEKTIVQLAALLHDLGYRKQFETNCKKDKHELYSCEEARSLLKDFNISDDIIESVVSAIKTHSNFKACKSLIQKLLYDADKLDKTTLGEVIRKSIICYEKYGMDELEIFKTLQSNLNKTRFHLNESKRIAQKNKKILMSVYKNYNSFINNIDD
jgi:HD superfamily phosphodiesterase